MSILAKERRTLKKNVYLFLLNLVFNAMMVLRHAPVRFHPVYSRKTGRMEEEKKTIPGMGKDLLFSRDKSASTVHARAYLKVKIRRFSLTSLLHIT